MRSIPPIREAVDALLRAQDEQAAPPVALAGPCAAQALIRSIAP
jgi:hypothetical protein